MTEKEKAKAYDEALERARKLYNSEETSADVEIACETIFPELAESEDERVRKDYKKILEGVVNIINTTEKSDIGFSDICAFIGENYPELKESEDEKIRKALICGMNALKTNRKKETFAAIPIDDCITWLEKQGKKPKWNEEDKEQCDLLIEQLATLKRTLALDFRNEIKWLKSLKQSHDNFEKTCKNDPLLDLLNKIPSCITVDGIDYHFVLKKTIAYMTFYEGEGEGSGKVIFWMAGDPVDLLTEMLEKLKEKGLLE